VGYDRPRAPCSLSDINNKIEYEDTILVETQLHIRLVMDINLPEAELGWWTRHLGRRFDNLQDIGEEFAPSSMSAQFHQKMR
jgi:hypothetical protein